MCWQTGWLEGHLQRGKILYKSTQYSSWSRQTGKQNPALIKYSTNCIVSLMMLNGEVKHLEKGEYRLCCLVTGSCSHLEPSACGAGPGFLTLLRGLGHCTPSPQKERVWRLQVQRYAWGFCVECCLGLSSFNVVNSLNEILF